MFAHTLLLCSLVKPANLAQLVSYIAEPRWPENASEKESFRYPYVATEVFCCNNPKLISQLLDGLGSCLPSPDCGFATRRAAVHAMESKAAPKVRHIHRLMAVVDAGFPIQEYRVSYVTRVLAGVAGSSPLRLMACVASCPFPLAKRALQHAHIPATGELLQLLIGLPWPEGSAATAALALSEADVAVGSGDSASLPHGLLHALGANVGGSWLAVSHSESLAAAETAHGVLAYCIARMLVAPTDDFKQTHSFARQPMRGASADTTVDSAPSPFSADVPLLTRAHAGSRMDPALYARGASASQHCTPASQCIKAILHNTRDAHALLQAAAHSVCQPPPMAAGVTSRSHLAAALKPAATPAQLREALSAQLQAPSSAFDTLWVHGEWALLTVAAALRVAARASGGLLASVDGRAAGDTTTAPALVSATGAAIPLLCAHVHALCDAAEEYASGLPPISAGPAARGSRVGKALVCKEAHHLPRLGALPMAVVRVLTAWLACRWQPADAAGTSSAWIALLRLMRFFPWASLLHQEVAKAAEGVLVQGSAAAVGALVLEAKLPQWILKRSNEQRLLADCSKPFAAAPSLTVGYMPQTMAVAQCAEAARLAKQLPAEVQAAFESQAWSVFVGGALTTHILRQSVTLGGPVPSGKNLSGDMGDLRVDEVPPAA